MQKNRLKQEVLIPHRAKRDLIAREVPLQVRARLISDNDLIELRHSIASGAFPSFDFFS